MSIGSRRIRRSLRKVMPVATQNILAGKQFTSSVADSSSEPGNSVAYLTDDNTSTRWISQPTSPVALTLDMQGIYSLQKVTIIFAADTIKNYTISVCSDASSWTTIATGVTNNTLSQTIDHTSFSGSAQGRYLRVTGTDRWDAAYGNSIWEIKAYGTFIQSVPVGTITGFAAQVASDTAATLSWNYSGSPIASYTLTRNGTAITPPAPSAKTYNDSGLTAGTDYIYALTANLQGGGTSSTVTASTRTSGGSVSTGYPAKEIAMYQMMWADSPGNIQNLPAKVNVVRLAFANRGSSGTDPLQLVGYGPTGRSTLLSVLSQLRSRGCKIMISLAGSGYVVTLSDTANVINSIQAIYDDLGGIDGIDFDLEKALPGNAAQEHLAVAQGCKSRFGAGFSISIAPGGANYDAYYPVAQHLNDNGCLDSIMHQFYEGGDNSITVVRSQVQKTLSLGIPASKIGVGMMTPNIGTLGADQYWTIAECTSMMQAMKNEYGLTRAFLWEQGDPESGTWANAMASVIG